MAGDWIKMEVSLSDKPEVIQMSTTLGLDQDAVVGKLFRVWCWADQQCVNCDAPGVTESFIDRYTGVTGFAKSMQEVGWLELADGGISFPNFDRHNGKSAKTRALTRNRMRRSRDAASVTPASPEKRREEIIYLYAPELIPARMNTEPVLRNFQVWQEHLQRQSKPPVAVGTESEELFWKEQLKRGPSGFVDAVQYTIANGWINLRDRPSESTTEAQSGSGSKKALDRVRGKAC